MSAVHPSLGLYVHVPFCASSCDYCAFYQEMPDRLGVGAFLDCVVAEWGQARHGGALLPVDTVFWGGGTPGVLVADDAGRLARSLREGMASAPVEWTVELAPSTVKADKIERLLEAGVNRFSLGVQSFDDATLRHIGRRQSAAQARKAFALLRELGCRNVNLDLIIAIPGQTDAQLEADLRAAIELGPEHLSTYCLTFEDDTPLKARLLAGKLVKRDEDEEAACYDRVREVLECAGFRQYEVSNYARPGRECLHNLNTWRMGEWLGLGPSAASQYGGLRWTNAPDLKAWGGGVRSGIPARTDVVHLDDTILAADALVFGLRMMDGVDLAGLRHRFPSAPWDRLDPLWSDLREAGLLADDASRLRLNRAGILLADHVARLVLDRF